MESVKLIIEMTADGKTKVNGPIHNKSLCYGMLESAKDAIREFIANNQSSVVVAPSELAQKFKAS